MAIANAILEEVCSVQPFAAVHLEPLVVYETKLVFSLWENFQTVIALVQSKAVWKKEIKVFNYFNSIVYVL